MDERNETGACRCAITPHQAARSAIIAIAESAPTPTDAAAATRSFHV
jgi:hypothetical protein